MLLIAHYTKRCSEGLRSGLDEGHSSSSTPSLRNHVFLELNLMAECAHTVLLAILFILCMLRFVSKPLVQTNICSTKQIHVALLYMLKKSYIYIYKRIKTELPSTLSALTKEPPKFPFANTT